MAKEHPASQSNIPSRLINTLPFVCVLDSFNLFRSECASVPSYWEEKGSSTCGPYGAKVGRSLMSFCESLASDTLLQGLREGSDKIAKSNYLSVERSKKCRWQNSSGSGPSETESEGMLVSCKQDDVNFTLAIVVEGLGNSSDVCSSESNLGNGLALGTERSNVSRTNSEIEFVGLDVLALEKMSSRGCESPEQKRTVNYRLPCGKGVTEIFRSSTDYDIQSRRQGYDPRSIYDISEFPEASGAPGEPLVAVRSATIAGYISHISEGHRAPPPPPEMMPFLEEPLLLVGPKLEWEGYVKARKISSERRRKRRQQHMTPQELNKMTRMVIGYTLAFFLLVIITFYIVYFV